MVWYLLSSTIYDVRHLIGHNKFLILSSKAVSNEKAVFDLDGTDHVLWKLLLHRLLHLLDHVLLRNIILHHSLLGAWIILLRSLIAHSH